jgi:hypothetical protein
VSGVVSGCLSGVVSGCQYLGVCAVGSIAASTVAVPLQFGSAATDLHATVRFSIRSDGPAMRLAGLLMLVETAIRAATERVGPARLRSDAGA